MKTYRIAAFAALTCGLAVAAKGTEYYEVEPNDTLAQATVVDNLRHGDRLAGFSFQDPDHFRVRTRDLAMGRIHMHTLWVDFAGSNNLDIVERHFDGSILVSSPDGIPASRQRWVNSPGYILKHKWFSFGGVSEIAWRMSSRTGSPSFGDYATRYEHAELQVEDLGAFQPGNIRFEQVPISPTYEGSIVVYNERGELVIAGFGSRSQGGYSLEANLSPGVYFVALNIGLLHDHTGALTGARVIGDNAVLVNGATEDFSFVAPTTVTGHGRSVTTDPRADLMNGQPFSLAWRKLTVVPEPGTMTGIGLGLIGAALLKRGKR